MKTGAKVSSKECNKDRGIKRNQTWLTTTWNYLCEESLTSIIRKTGKEQGSKAEKRKKENFGVSAYFMRSYTNFRCFMLILVIYTVILGIFTPFFGANFPNSFGANINVFFISARVQEICGRAKHRAYQVEVFRSWLHQTTIDKQCHRMFGRTMIIQNCA